MGKFTDYINFFPSVCRRFTHLVEIALRSIKALTKNEQLYYRNESIHSLNVMKILNNLIGCEILHTSQRLRLNYHHIENHVFHRIIELKIVENTLDSRGTSTIEKFISFFPNLKCLTIERYPLPIDFGKIEALKVEKLTIRMERFTNGHWLHVNLLEYIGKIRESLTNLTYVANSRNEETEPIRTVHHLPIQFIIERCPKITSLTINIKDIPIEIWCANNSTNLRPNLIGYENLLEIHVDYMSAENLSIITWCCEQLQSLKCIVYSTDNNQRKFLSTYEGLKIIEANRARLQSITLRDSDFRISGRFPEQIFRQQVVDILKSSAFSRLEYLNGYQLRNNQFLKLTPCTGPLNGEGLKRFIEINPQIDSIMLRFHIMFLYSMDDVVDVVGQDDFKIKKLNIYCILDQEMGNVVIRENPPLSIVSGYILRNWHEILVHGVRNSELFTRLLRQNPTAEKIRCRGIHVNTTDLVQFPWLIASHCPRVRDIKLSTNGRNQQPEDIKNFNIQQVIENYDRLKSIFTTMKDLRTIKLSYRERAACGVEDGNLIYLAGRFNLEEELLSNIFHDHPQLCLLCLELPLEQREKYVEAILASFNREALIDSENIAEDAVKDVFAKNLGVLTKRDCKFIIYFSQEPFSRSQICKFFFKIENKKIVFYVSTDTPDHLSSLEELDRITSRLPHLTHLNVRFKEDCSINFDSIMDTLAENCPNLQSVIIEDKYLSHAERSPVDYRSKNWYRKMTNLALLNDFAILEGINSMRKSIRYMNGDVNWYSDHEIQSVTECEYFCDCNFCKF